MSVSFPPTLTLSASAHAYFSLYFYFNCFSIIQCLSFTGSGGPAADIRRPINSCIVSSVFRLDRIQPWLLVSARERNTTEKSRNSNALPKSWSDASILKRKQYLGIETSERFISTKTGIPEQALKKSYELCVYGKRDHHIAVVIGIDKLRTPLNYK